MASTSASSARRAHRGHFAQNRDRARARVDCGAGRRARRLGLLRRRWATALPNCASCWSIRQPADGARNTACQQCIAFARAAGYRELTSGPEPARGHEAPGLRARRAGASNGAVRHAAGVGSMAARAAPPAGAAKSRRECHSAPPSAAGRNGQMTLAATWPLPLGSRHVCSSMSDSPASTSRLCRDRRRARPW